LVALALAGLQWGLAPLVQAQGAPAESRVRGTVAAFDGKILTVKSRDGAELKLTMPERPSVSTVRRITLADIGKGAYVGVTAVQKPDGSLVAREVHLFPAMARGTGEGHRAWDLEPGSSMTNASIDAISDVSSVDGESLQLSYKGGTQKIRVPANIPMVELTRGSVDLLKPGTVIFAIVQTQPDGSRVAARITAGKDGVQPPM
jgi:hypothetical protein